MALKEVETSFGYCERDKGFFSSNEQRWITHIRRLAEKHPNECMILEEPENNGGFIYARMPTTWLQVRAPKTVNMTEEQRATLAERLKKARESKQGD